MHELSICQAIIVQLERIACEEGARVISFTLGIGPLSGVEAALVETAYPLAAAGTQFASARMVIDPLPVRVRCRSCKAESTVASNRLLCDQCGDWQTELVNGSELLLTSVELERNELKHAAIN